MSIATGTEKRKGKKVITTRIGVSKQKPIVKGITLQEGFNLFVRVKDAENIKPRTRKEYFNLFRYFMDFLEKYYPDVSNVEDVTTTSLRDYIYYLANEKIRYEGNPYKKEEHKREIGLSPYTINIRIRFLKAFFNVMVKEEIIIRSPMENVKLMKVDEDTKDPLTEDEVRVLLQQPDRHSFAQSRDLVMMLLMIDTGMRVNEICSLEVRDIDFKTRCINLPAVKNKNRKPRIIPLSGEVTRLLMDLIVENREHFDTNYVFISNFGEALNIDSVRNAIKKYAQKAGITKTVSPHAFRHFFAKQAALNGMDIFTLQRTLGHADISTTRKYIQLDKEDLITQHNLYSPLQKIIKRK